MWFFDRIVSIKILPKIGQQLTSNITNVGRSGGLKASAPHQHLQLLTGKSPALRHWSYCKPLMRNLNNPSVLRTPGLVLAHQRLGCNPLVVLSVFQTV